MFSVCEWRVFCGRKCDCMTIKYCSVINFPWIEKYEYFALTLNIFLFFFGREVSFLECWFTSKFIKIHMFMPFPSGTWTKHHFCIKHLTNQTWNIQIKTNIWIIAYDGCISLLLSFFPHFDNLWDLKFYEIFEFHN